MKHLLLSVSALLLSAAALAQHQHDRDHLICKETEAAAARLRYQPGTAGTNYDLHYHRMRWAVDPAVRYITGEVTSHFIATEANVGSIRFDFSSQLSIDSIRYHGQPVPHQQIGNELEITLPAALAMGQADSVSIWYQGNPPQTGFGSFIRMNHATGPIIWTLSDPWGGKDWWPCKMTLDDKIDSVDIFITTPQAFKAGSNGKLMSTQTVGTNKIYHWRHRFPITSYLIAMAISNYEEFSSTVQLSQGPLEFLNYAYPHTFTAAQTQAAALEPILQYYDSLIVPYPYMGEKYGQAQFSWAGGMEHQTMSFVSNFSRDLMAHELAHQWFGNQVTVGSWADMWLSEGWATYMEGLVYERMNTPQQWLQWKVSQINTITNNGSGSVYVTDTTNINRIFDARLTYAKGGMLLHMLRWKVGDSAFFAATRNYLNDPQLRYGYARTADFQNHLEQASGQNLDEFFTDWFYGHGHPSYQVQWHQAMSSGNLVVTINQTQSHPSVSFFEMPVPVRFSDGVRDTILVFDHTSSGQTFTVPLDFYPTTASLDPDRWILHRNSSILSAVDALPEAAVQVFPNPASDMLQVSVESAADAPLQARLFDALGREVLSQTMAAAEARSFGLDMRQLPAGAYHLQLQTGSWTISRKVLKK